MRKYKRITIALIMICMLTMQIYSIFINAAAEPTITLSAQEETSDDLIVSLSFTPDVSAAGTITINYDKDALSLEKTSKGSAKAEMININKTDDGTIKVNFLDPYGPIGGNTELAVLRFTKTKGYVTNDMLTVSSFKLYNIDSVLLSDEKTAEVNYEINFRNGESSVAEISTESKEDASEKSAEESINDISDSEASKNQETPVIEKSNDEKISQPESQPDSGTASQTSVEEKSCQSSISVEEIISEPEKSSDNNESKTAESETDEQSKETSSSDETEKQKKNNTALIIILLATVVLGAAAGAVVIIRKQRASSENKKSD